MRTLSTRSFWDRLTDRDTPKRRVRIEALRRELVAILDERRVIDEYAARRIYSRDMVELPVWLERLLFRTTPHLVLQPMTMQEISRACEVARRHDIPVIPRGIGSWAYGGAVPTIGGIVFDLSLMDGVDAPDPAAGTVTVDAGARFGVVDETLSAQGLTLAVSPSNRMATVGGWVATGGYGVSATGRGHLRRWVQALDVITIDGAVRAVEAADPEFPLWFGSEGQYGFIARVRLKVLRRPVVSEPRLLYFARDEAALGYLSTLLELGIRPEHAKFLNADHMAAINAAHAFRRADPGPAHAVLDERPAVLLHFSDLPSIESFEAARGALAEPDGEAPLHAASYLWHERFHPLRVQVLGPSMLAAEHLVSTADYPLYASRARSLAKRFGVTLFLEATPVLRDEGDHEMLSIASFKCDRRKGAQYGLYLLLVQMLNRIAVRLGARPYGVGIWNSPFFAHVHPRRAGRERIAMKRQIDPRGLLNPRKFNRVRTRFWNVPGFFFRPNVFKGFTDAALLLSRPLGRLARALGVAPIAERHPLDRWAAECTNCGNCVSVCPAYQVTQHEGTTGRQKLKIGLRALHGERIPKAESDRVFLCLYCNACTDICQTGIPLTESYRMIEDLLEAQNGKPMPAIETFVGGLGTNPRYLRLVGSEAFDSDVKRGRRRPPVAAGGAAVKPEDGARVEAAKERGDGR
jgi:FAD/FMN-containing dehydrogenase/ferredoxin